MFGLGMGEVVVILVIVLLLFGPSRLPEMARALGKTIKEFNRVMRDVSDEGRDKEGKEKHD